MEGKNKISPTTESTGNKMKKETIHSYIVEVYVKLFSIFHWKMKLLKSDDCDPKQYLIYLFTAGINNTDYTIDSTSNNKWGAIDIVCPAYSVKRLILLIYKVHGELNVT